MFRLKECIMFFGETMGPREVVHSGINARLMFKSLFQRFECPLSTTAEVSVADRFSTNEETGRKGVRLLLRRANPKTRYFNVAPFTFYGNEDERLFMGSTLKIADISIGVMSFEFYVSALLMLEQLMRGRFIDNNKKTRKYLLLFLRRAIALSVVDELSSDQTLNNKSGVHLNIYLEKEEYDTDAVIDDIEHCYRQANPEGDIDIIVHGAVAYNESNIHCFVGDQDVTAKISESIKKTKGKFFTFEVVKEPAHYINSLYVTSSLYCSISIISFCRDCEKGIGYR